MRVLQVLGRLYNSFGIQGQSTGKSQVSLPDVASNVSFVSDNIKRTISEVKQKHGMKEATATNGPEGTVSNKTQVSHQEQGMRRLHESIATTNNEYLEEVELSTLLTTVVENIHANSHFKHETFTALPYSQTLEPSQRSLSRELQNGGPSILPTTSRIITSQRPSWILEV